MARYVVVAPVVPLCRSGWEMRGLEEGLMDPALDAPVVPRGVDRLRAFYDSARELT